MTDEVKIKHNPWCAKGDRCDGPPHCGPEPCSQCGRAKGHLILTRQGFVRLEMGAGPHPKGMTA